MTHTHRLCTPPSLKAFVAALALCSVAHSSLAQSAPAAPAASEFEAALAEYERNHWPQAYEALTRLADQGHPEAARIALLMRRYGPALYGREFSASVRPAQLRAQR